MSIKRMPITIALVLGLLGMAGCTNSDDVRYQLKAESENNYGVTTSW